MTPLYTDVEVATDVLKIPVEELHALRKRHGWPCTKVGRFNVRFTEEQVQQIVAMQAQAPSRFEGNVVSIPGQTARSAARGRR